MVGTIRPIGDKKWSSGVRLQLDLDEQTGVHTMTLRKNKTHILIVKRSQDGEDIITAFVELFEMARIDEILLVWTEGLEVVSREIGTIHEISQSLATQFEFDTECMGPWDTQEDPIKVRI